VSLYRDSLVRLLEACTECGANRYYCADGATLVPGIRATQGVYTLCHHASRGEYRLSFNEDGGYECEKAIGWKKRAKA
jgi:hypothetical protein